MSKQRDVPTYEEVQGYLRDRRNWGRWGGDDQRGAINLITPDKCAAAAGLVRSGRTVSLARPFPKVPGPRNTNPGHHYLTVRWKDEDTGVAADYVGLNHHGYNSTHIDALCHIWDEDGMWGGRDPRKVLTTGGSTWGGIEHWADGIITRGVLMDVPRYRGEPHVTTDRPVHGWELDEIARAENIVVAPGDALVVFGGRAAWEASGPDWSTHPPPVRPGLHPSCLPYVRDNDVAVLVWDLMDIFPNPYGMLWNLHGAIISYGVALVDNARLEPLAAACADERRYEFELIITPLPIEGATGCPVNPIARF